MKTKTIFTLSIAALLSLVGCHGNDDPSTTSIGSPSSQEPTSSAPVSSDPSSNAPSTGDTEDSSKITSSSDVDNTVTLKAFIDVLTVASERDTQTQSYTALTNDETTEGTTSREVVFYDNLFYEFSEESVNVYGENSSIGLVGWTTAEKTHYATWTHDNNLGGRYYLEEASLLDESKRLQYEAAVTKSGFPANILSTINANFGDEVNSDEVKVAKETANGVNAYTVTYEGLVDSGWSTYWTVWTINAQVDDDGFLVSCVEDSKMWYEVTEKPAEGTAYNDHYETIIEIEKGDKLTLSDPHTYFDPANYLVPENADVKLGKIVDSAFVETSEFTVGDYLTIQVNGVPTTVDEQLTILVDGKQANLSSYLMPNFDDGTFEVIATGSPEVVISGVLYKGLPMTITISEKTGGDVDTLAAALVGTWACPDYFDDIEITFYDDGTGEAVDTYYDDLCPFTWEVDEETGAVTITEDPDSESTWKDVVGQALVSATITLDEVLTITHGSGFLQASRTWDKVS